MHFFSSYKSHSSMLVRTLAVWLRPDRPRFRLAVVSPPPGAACKCGEVDDRGKVDATWVGEASLALIWKQGRFSGPFDPDPAILGHPSTGINVTGAIDMYVYPPGLGRDIHIVALLHGLLA
jgi:hypothetical protein